MTTITALPTAPSRADPANFRSRADAFMAALPTFATETNTVADEVNTNAATATTQAGIATTQAGNAATSASNALLSENAAAASALTALNAPGTSATSTTSLTVGTGSKTLTIQTGKSIVPGMTIVVARTAAPANRMGGVVDSYNSGTGSLVFTSTGYDGSGTHTDWTVSLSAAVIGSDLAKRVIQVKVIDDLTTLTTGDGKVIFLVPQELNGYNLVGANAFVTTVSSSGTPTVQIRNVTDAVDMLSTRITIDANEYTSYTAAAAAVVDATYDDVATGDRLAVDVDVAGTGAKGLGIVLTFQLP